MRCAAPVMVMVLATGCALASKDRAMSQGEVDRTLSVADVPVRGFPVSVEARNEAFPDIEGELLAVDKQHLWVLSDGKLVHVHRHEVESATVRVLDTNTGFGLGVWTLLGTASALSHGVLFVLSGPIWLAVGVPVAAVTSSQEKARFDGPAFTGLWQFARFPQGLPPSRWMCPQHQPMPGDGEPGPWAPPPEAEQPPLVPAQDESAPPPL